MSDEKTYEQTVLDCQELLKQLNNKIANVRYDYRQDRENLERRYHDDLCALEFQRGLLVDLLSRTAALSPAPMQFSKEQDGPA